LSAAELSWLASALRQPGYKLPGYDENGEPVTAETILTCLDMGLIEPWVPSGGEALPKVCRLTEKGEIIAETHLLGRGGTEAGSFERPLDDILTDDADEPDALSNWWEELPGSLPQEQGSGSDEPARELPPLPSSRARRKPTQADPAVKRRRYEAELDSQVHGVEAPPPGKTGREVIASLRERLGHRSRQKRGRELIRASARFAGASGLLALGFALGWSIDPPNPRIAGDRIAIVSEEELGAQQAPLPRVEDILSLEPSAGPDRSSTPRFLAPIEDAPAREDAAPAAAPPSAKDRLPALEDPQLMERWDRVEAEPAPFSGAGNGADMPPAQLAALPRSEGQTVERILLPGAPLSHGAPLYPAEESKEGLYSVEMAAFAEPDLAEAAKTSLVRAHGDLLSRDSVTVAAIDGAVEEQRYRVVADPLALKTAEDLCRALRKRGQGCQVIPMTSVSPPASGQISAD
jgi:hypothetical protein